MKNLLLPLVRHVVGIIIGAISAYLSLSTDQVQQLEEALIVVMMTVFALVWVLLEKLLKIPFRKYFGEQQPGDTNPIEDK